MNEKKKLLYSISVYVTPHGGDIEGRSTDTLVDWIEYKNLDIFEVGDRLGEINDYVAKELGDTFGFSGSFTCNSENEMRKQEAKELLILLNSMMKGMN